MELSPNEFILKSESSDSAISSSSSVIEVPQSKKMKSSNSFQNLPKVQQQLLSPTSANILNDNMMLKTILRRMTLQYEGAKLTNKVNSMTKKLQNELEKSNAHEPLHNYRYEESSDEDEKDDIPDHITAGVDNLSVSIIQDDDNNRSIISPKVGVAVTTTTNTNNNMNNDLNAYSGSTSASKNATSTSSITDINNIELGIVRKVNICWCICVI